MREHAVVGRCRRRFTTTTVSDPPAAAVDLVKRVFGPGTVEVDEPAGPRRGWSSTPTAEPCQYTSAEYRRLLDAHGIIQSFSRPRQCWDNAVAESFFSILKEELIHRQPWATRAQVRRAVFDFIEVLSTVSLPLSRA